MAKQRLLALLNFDIVGYSTRTSEDQDKETARKDALIAAARAEAAAAGGRVVKTKGDEAFIVFTTARGAAKVAVALNRPDNPPLRFGISLGDIRVVENCDVDGHTVNTACRLQKWADTGTILVTQAVAEQLYVYPEFCVTLVGELDLKGIGPAAVFAISAGPKPDSQDRSMFRSAEIANKRLTQQLALREAQIEELKHEAGLTQERLKDTRRMLLLTRALRTFEQQLPQCEQRYAEAIEVETRYKADNEPDWLEEMMNIQNRWQMQHADVIADAYQEIGEPGPPFPTLFQYRKLPLSYDRKFFDEAPAFHDAVRNSISSVQREIGQLQGKVQ